MGNVYRKALVNAMHYSLEAPVETGNNTVAGVKAYTTVNTVNELKGQALVYTQAYAFAQANAKSVTDTLACY